MNQRIRIIPVEPMARRLAGRPAADRASVGAAIAALTQEGYCLDDIDAGIDRAMARAAQLVVAAASDAPWALRLGYLRDLVAASVLVGLIAYAWGVLA